MSHPRGTGRGGSGNQRGGEVSFCHFILNGIFSCYNSPSCLLYSSFQPFIPPHAATFTLIHIIFCTASTFLSILTSSRVSPSPPYRLTLARLLPINPPRPTVHLYCPAAGPGSNSGGPGQWQVPIRRCVITRQNSRSGSDGPVRQRCRNFESSPLGWRRG